jgi:hypothetical protein
MKPPQRWGGPGDRPKNKYYHRTRKGEKEKGVESPEFKVQSSRFKVQSSRFKVHSPSLPSQPVRGKCFIGSPLPWWWGLGEKENLSPFRFGKSSN